MRRFGNIALLANVGLVREDWIFIISVLVTCLSMLMEYLRMMDKTGVISHKTYAEHLEDIERLIKDSSS